jgi:hypothetical protein
MIATCTAPGPLVYQCVGAGDMTLVATSGSFQVD